MMMMTIMATTIPSSLQHLSSQYSKPYPPPLPLPASAIGNFCKTVSRTTSRRRCVIRSSDNRTAVVSEPTSTSSAVDGDDDESSPSDSASEVVRNFYVGINGHDLASVEDLIAHNCVYEDLIFARPFVGRKAILEFFQKFIDSISTDLQFVIDDISDEGTSTVGVTWHLEWRGKPFPFSKGCSFYRLDLVNGKRQIVYGRDCVEPATKPGEMALVAIRGVTWLLQRFPQLADHL